MGQIRLFLAFWFSITPPRTPVMDRPPCWPEGRPCPNNCAYQLAERTVYNLTPLYGQWAGWRMAGRVLVSPDGDRIRNGRATFGARCQGQNQSTIDACDRRPPACPGAIRRLRPGRLLPQLALCSPRQAVGDG